MTTDLAHLVKHEDIYFAGSGVPIHPDDIACALRNPKKKAVKSIETMDATDATISQTHWITQGASHISESGNVHFCKPENEREMAMDTISNAHLLLIIMGIAVNNFFKLEADGVIEGLGKDFERVCLIKHDAGQTGVEGIESGL